MAAVVPLWNSKWRTVVADVLRCRVEEIPLGPPDPSFSTATATPQQHQPAFSSGTSAAVIPHRKVGGSVMDRWGLALSAVTDEGETAGEDDRWEEESEVKGEGWEPWRSPAKVADNGNENANQNSLLRAQQTTIAKAICRDSDRASHDQPDLEERYVPLLSIIVHTSPHLTLPLHLAL